MALITCPECGIENVSDTAISCPSCGYNIKKYVAIKQAEEERKKKAEIRKNRPQMSKKQKVLIVLFVMLVIAIFTASIIVLNAIKTKKSFEKDLSHIFDVNFNMTEADIIALESNKFENIEYERDYNYDNTFVILRFETYKDTDGEIRYNHQYWFDMSTQKLISVSYGDYYDYNVDKADRCQHVDYYYKSVNTIVMKSGWDEVESDTSWMFLNGNINGVKCKIWYEEASRWISLYSVSE